MSVEQAFDFLRKARAEPALRARIAETQHELTADALVALGSEFGCTFDAHELNEAHRHEWTMRWLHFRSSQGR